MSILSPCPSCGRHSLRGETCCPHCGNCARSGRSSAAALVGLALAAGACDNGISEEMDVEPAYGVVMTDTGDHDDTGDTGEP